MNNNATVVFVSSIKAASSAEPRFVQFVHNPPLRVGETITISDNKRITYTGVIKQADWKGNHILDCKPSIGEGNIKTLPKKEEKKMDQKRRMQAQPKRVSHYGVKR